MIGKVALVLSIVAVALSGAALVEAHRHHDASGRCGVSEPATQVKTYDDVTCSGNAEPDASFGVCAP